MSEWAGRGSRFPLGTCPSTGVFVSYGVVQGKIYTRSDPVSILMWSVEGGASMSTWLLSAV